ncbi:amino acid deaminase/aldolase [Candidatus Uabimicrobium amorphum]|uniref:Amino acid aldolase n=1 Tax=Uabimicrobium amorphum TaxID=2596890 RepID=A0A5S9IJK9_UABAM|nr:amino acid deaminase/aldolase [Candidatus Uabimicrobium amorphum]BBM82720.1 amino acid aldolase [Candidatus Uabimicrobium amorphum]
MVDKYDYYKNATCAIAMPFAALDMELFEENIEKVAKRACEKPIRIASKSIRSVELIKRILNSHSIFQGVMSYSADEAIYLHNSGIEDILVAYPIFDPRRIRSICQLTQTNITLMVDCIDHARQISQICCENNTTLPICVDVDMSSSFPGIHFGVRRSPLNTAQQVLQLVQEMDTLPGVSFAGVMGYEAQIAGLGDKSPFNNFIMNAVIRQLKKISIQQIQKRRQNVVETLQQNGFSCKIVNGGGTGSLETTSLEPCITEVTAGSAFFSPGLFDYYCNFQHNPALFYAIEVTRTPTANIFTCHGGGYVASGTGKDKIPQPYLPKKSKLLDTEGAGEVQTPVVYRGKKKIQLGDPIFMRHSKAGELCEHFNSIHLVKNGKVVDEVSTYRGEGKCFL